MEYLRVRYGGPGQTFVYQLRSEEEETNRNHCGVAGGARGPRGGAVKAKTSPAMTRVQTPTARFCRKYIKGQRGRFRQNQIVVVPKSNGTEKPNGHGLAKRAAVK